MENHGVYIEKRDVYQYPGCEDSFSPHISYPEYPWGKDTISKIENHIYDMVRNTFIAMQLDRENVNTVEWNPLGEFIKQGDNVLIKPNMVLHENHIKEMGLDCVITHPSLVRVVADYVCIALKGTGSICIGDAPLQSCDFDVMVKNAGYIPLLQFLRERHANVRLQDFRLVSSRQSDGYLYDVKSKEGDVLGYTAVDLGTDSLHMETIEQYKKMRVTNYDPRKMKEHHNPQKNEYLVPNTVLQSDVVINMPKPKTHRKGGVTIAMKNLIGINGHKDWLPHHKKGSTQEGGDEYLARNIFKSISVNIQEKVDVISIQGKNVVILPLKFVQKFFAILGKVTSKLFGRDLYIEGSWYGNDTIWRTICDLNRVLLYADKQGVLQPQKQRTYLIIGDMIISGEREGPLQPTPKKAGMVAIGKDPVAFDAVICTIMGFDYHKIPSICNGCQSFKYKLSAMTDVSDATVYSNILAWNNQKVGNIRRCETMCYVPTNGWKGHIELD